MTVRLKNAREFTREADSLQGMPANPRSRADLLRKLMFTVGDNEAAIAKLYERLERLDTEPRFSI